MNFSPQRSGGKSVFGSHAERFDSVLSLLSFLILMHGIFRQEIFSRFTFPRFYGEKIEKLFIYIPQEAL